MPAQADAPAARLHGGAHGRERGHEADAHGHGVDAHGQA